MYISQNIYNQLDIFLKKNIYQSGILLNQRTKIKSKIYKQYINFEKIDKLISSDRVHKRFNPLTVNSILKKRKELESVINTENFLVEDIILYDSAARDFISEFPPKSKSFLVLL